MQTAIGWYMERQAAQADAQTARDTEARMSFEDELRSQFQQPAEGLGKNFYDVAVGAAASGTAAMLDTGTILRKKVIESLGALLEDPDAEATPPPAPGGTPGGIGVGSSPASCPAHSRATQLKIGCAPKTK